MSDDDQLVLDAIADHTTPTSEDDVVHAALRDAVRAEKERLRGTLWPSTVTKRIELLGEQIEASAHNARWGHGHYRYRHLVCLMACAELLVQRDEALRAEVLRGAK